MKVNNKWFYFGKIPLEHMEEHDGQEGWEEGYYFRIAIDTENEEFKVEDTCGRVVPLCFENLFEFQQVLAKVQGELLSTLIGAPNPNV